MNYRDRLINPEAPKEVASFSEWDEKRDGWEGLTEQNGNCEAVVEAVKWMNDNQNLYRTDGLSKDVVKYVDAVRNFFIGGYHKARDSYLPPFKEMLECRTKHLFLNAMANKKGAGTKWVRGTGVNVSTLDKLKPTSVKKQSGSRGVIRVEYDFMYTSSAMLQSWCDDLLIASRFAANDKNNEKGRIGIMITASIPASEMLFSVTFTDTIKKNLGYPNEYESIRVGNSPLKVKGVIHMRRVEAFSILDTTLPFAHRLMKKVNDKEAKTIQNWINNK